MRGEWAKKATAVLLLAIFVTAGLAINGVQGTSIGTEWDYKAQITIGTAASTQTNYPVNITVYKGTGSNSAGIIYLNNHALNWPIDICFTDSSNGLIPCWRESYTTTVSYWWVNLSSISSSTNTNYFIYYGKASASDASNGESTFTLFDDFTGTSLSALWSNQGGSESFASSAVTTYPSSDYGGFRSASSIALTNGVTLRFRGKWANFVGLQESIGFSDRTDATNWYDHPEVTYRGTYNGVNNDMQKWLSRSGSNNISVDAATLAITYSVFDIYAMVGSAPVFHCNGVLKTAPTGTIPSATYYLWPHKGYNTHNSAETSTLDWVLVRKCLSTEPSWVSAGAESLGSWNPSFTNSPGTIGAVGTFWSYLPTLNESGIFTVVTKLAWAIWASGNSTLYGTPISPGIDAFHITGTSTNGFGSTELYWNVTVKEPWACSFTSSPVLTGTATILYSYHITLNATGTVTYLGAPSWLSISGSKNGTTGPWYLNETPPSTGGTFSIKLRAYTSVGLLYSWGNYTLSVNATPSITSTPALSIPQFDDYSYLATADQPGTWYLLSNATWLTPDEPYINGTPGVGDVGSYWVMVEITNANGTTYGNFTLTVGNTAPTITSSPVLDGYVGFFYRYDADASEPVTWVITCSYPNIDVDSSGVVSGFLSTGDLNMSGDSITVHLLATDLNGDVAYQNFTIITGGPQDKVIPIALALFPIIIAIILIGVFSESAYLKRKLR